MIGIIYKLTSPSNKIYIGQTMNIVDRKRKFYHFAKRYAGTKINNAIKKYGPEKFLYEVLVVLDVFDVTELRNWLDKLEIKYIKLFNSYESGYNMTTGGSGSKGCFPTENSRKKLSEFAKTRTGNKNPFYNKKHTDESKKKMSEYAKTRTSYKNPFYNKKHTDETKRKIMISNGKEIYQIDANTNEIIAWFHSAREAARSLNKNEKTCGGEICKVCNSYKNNDHKHISAYGYIWKYKESSTTSKSI